MFLGRSCGQLWQAHEILRLASRLLSTGAALVLLSSLGCDSKSKRRSQPLAPLSAPAWRTELPVKGFGAATLALPLGATSPRPIVVVLHGARDRADWQCGSFRGLFGGSVFILCPQGVLATGQGGLYGLGSIDDSIAELRAGLAALKARFGAHVAPSPIVLVGYAEGAAVAADLARQEPSFFARVALVNGNPAVFSPSATKIFAQHGGKRMLFFCLDDACESNAVERALLLSRAGVLAKAVKADVGPYLDPRFVDALRAETPWLLDGDARFLKHK
jgi:pimeloyl-ACP methyl ester carboxylesterase